MNDLYFWNMIEIEENEVKYCYHLLTLEKLNKNKLEDILKQIKTEEIAISFMSEKINGSVLFNKPFKQINSKDIKFNVGQKQYSKDFFDKNYQHSINSFNIIDLTTFEI